MEFARRFCADAFDNIVITSLIGTVTQTLVGAVQEPSTDQYRQTSAGLNPRTSAKEANSMGMSISVSR